MSTAPDNDVLEKQGEDEPPPFPTDLADRFSQLERFEVLPMQDDTVAIFCICLYSIAVCYGKYSVDK